MMILRYIHHPAKMSIARAVAENVEMAGWHSATSPNSLEISQAIGRDNRQAEILGNVIDMLHANGHLSDDQILSLLGGTHVKAE